MTLDKAIVWIEERKSAPGYYCVSMQEFVKKRNKDTGLRVALEICEMKARKG